MAVGNVGQGFSASAVHRDPLMDALEKSKFAHTISYLNGDLRQHFPLIDSTQIWAKELVDSIIHQENWLVITAEEQIAGRGTHDRRWLSPPEVNLYVTFVLPFPNEESKKVFFVSQVTAIAVARTVKEYGINPEIKWPNDLMLGKKRVSGMLCQAIDAVHEENSALLIGIGLNVNMGRELCDSLDQPVTSLLCEAGRTFDKEEILSRLHNNLKQCIQDLKTQGFSCFLDELNSLLAFKKEKIIIDNKDESPISGIFLGIDEMGRMQLQKEDGEIIVLDNGRIRREKKQ